MIKGYKILLCDDSVLMLKKLKEGIMRCCEDVEIYEAKNGKMAIELFQQHRPDLIFMDAVMPIKDGMQATKEIKKIDANAKVIITSSERMQVDIRNAKSIGTCEFIQKPWEQKNIENVIRKMI